jgi:DNA processing protein
MLNLFPTQKPSLAHMPLVDVLRLIRSTNVGAITFFRLIERYGTAAKALEKLPELSARGGSRQPLVPYSKSKAETEIERMEMFGARMVTFGASDYPALLMGIDDPPPLLTIMGHAHLWSSNQLVAMVGARNASANGCNFAGTLARELGEQGLVVVSGLARGIDTFAHKGALKSGTVAVVAGGIDQIYPPENKQLFAELAERGAIISEQPFGQAPFHSSFPSRNRIIAGMTLGTVVVEAALKSGSLITARNALDYHREVFAVPGSPMDPRAKGCNQLIRDGATMVESVNDIINQLQHITPATLNESKTSVYQTQIVEPDEAELHVARKALIEKLGINPVSVDELLSQCHVSLGVALTIMLELELAGRLTRHPGNQVSLRQEAIQEEWAG